MYDPLTALLIGMGVGMVTAVFFWPDRGLWFRWRPAQVDEERFVETAVADEFPTDSDPLTALAIGKRSQVIGISKQCRGAERRRFLDLGILPGTQIRAEMRSPSGDPVAYRIRGALIALRAEQAQYIWVRKLAVNGD